MARIKGRLKAHIWRRDKLRCQYCGRVCRLPKDCGEYGHPRMATVDHVIPIVAGGTDDPQNLVTACFTCNNRKGKFVGEVHWLSDDPLPTFTEDQLAENSRRARELARQIVRDELGLIGK